VDFTHPVSTQSRRESHGGTCVGPSPDCYVQSSVRSIGGDLSQKGERSSPVKNTAPYVTIQNLYDELEEAIDQQDHERIDRLRTEIRGEMAATAGWKAFADSAERNRMSDHTQRLLSSLGWRAVRIA
jgi:hypothetical protein